LITVALLALATTARHTTDREKPTADVSDGEALPGTVGNDDLPDLGFERPEYRYSVIPGGAYNRLELQAAIRNDPVVAGHYAQLDQSRVRSETVTRDRYVHVSYRKDDRIFWTKNTVLLRQGETILTDGKTQIRARCGNCISEEPLLPTSDEEPDVVDFDRLTDATTSSTWSTSDVVPTPPAATSAGAAATPAEEDPLTPLGAGRSVGLAPLAATSAHDSGGAATDAPADVYGPLFPWPGPEVGLPPLAGIPVPPSLGPDPFVPGNELFPGTPTIPGVGGNPIPPSDERPAGLPGDTSNPVPVPEPGTLLLVAGGVAALIRMSQSKIR
jgi:hypothetical protein